MLNYPLEMSFKIVAINPQVRVTDASGQLIAYVKQKAFKLKEDITIFGDEGQTHPLYRMNANRILDFNANYAITTPTGQPVGSFIGLARGRSGRRPTRSRTRAAARWA